MIRHISCFLISLVLSLPAFGASGDSTFLVRIAGHISSGRWKAAELLMAEADSVFSRNRQYEQLVSLLEMEVTLEKRRKNYGIALARQQRLKRVSDSVLAWRNERAVLAMEERFNEQERLKSKLDSQELSFLAMREKVQHGRLLNIQQQTSVLLLAAIALTILLLIALLVYRLKKRNTALQERLKLDTAVQHASLKKLVDRQVKLINEKEWLIREVHHRVKNNMQIIVSLLNFQTRNLQDEAAVAAINNSKNRVRAMSLIHQRLYQGESLQFVNMQTYVEELTGYLQEALAPAHTMSFRLAVAPVKMEVARAVPIGLLLNEAITNAIKYAFPGRNDGWISISLSETADDCHLLTISDNGIGLDVGQDGFKGKSLGFNLMQTMADQLGARFTVSGHGGLTIALVFKLRGETPQESAV